MNQSAYASLLPCDLIKALQPWPQPPGMQANGEELFLDICILDKISSEFPQAYRSSLWTRYVRMQGVLTKLMGLACFRKRSQALAQSGILPYLLPSGLTV